MRKGVWKTYEFVELRSKPQITRCENGELDFGEVYAANPYLWRGEGILTTAGSGCAWNSAVGGAANLMQRTSRVDVVRVVNVSEVGFDKAKRSSRLTDHSPQAVSERSSKFRLSQTQPYQASDLAMKKDKEDLIRTHFVRYVQCFKE